MPTYHEEWVEYTRHTSLELLVPPHDSNLRETSLGVATFNLVATIVGGGVLSLPLAFARAGIVLAFFMLLVAAVITEFSLYLLCSCARRTGSTSYMEIARCAFGEVAELGMSVLLWLFLCGVLVAYFVLMMGIYAPLLWSLWQNLKNPEEEGEEMPTDFGPTVLICILLLVSPFLLKKNLYSLRHICYVGFMSVCIIAISISVRAYQRNVFVHEYIGAGTAKAPRIKYTSMDWSDILFSFPICVLAFLCSFNIVEVHGALTNPTRNRIRGVIHNAVFASFFLFLFFSLAGYFFAYDDCKGNIFLNFDPSDPLITVGRLGMGVTLTFGTPVVLLPCREAFLSICSQTEEIIKKRNNSIKTLEETSLIQDGNQCRNDLIQNYSSLATHVDGSAENMQSRCVHVFTTLMIVTSAYYLAVSVPNVAIVWSVLGSTMGMLIGFVVPCACYLKIRRDKGMRLINIGAWALLCFSMVLTLACTYITIQGIFEQNNL